jgi:hypothetical protein
LRTQRRGVAERPGALRHGAAAPLSTRLLSRTAPPRRRAPGCSRARRRRADEHPASTTTGNDDANIIASDTEPESPASIVGDSVTVTGAMEHRGLQAGYTREQLELVADRNHARADMHGEPPSRPEHDPIDPELMMGRASALARWLMPAYLRAQEQRRHRQATHFGPGGWQGTDSPMRAGRGGMRLDPGMLKPGTYDAPTRRVADFSRLAAGRGLPTVGPGGRPIPPAAQHALAAALALLTRAGR